MENSQALSGDAPALERLSDTDRVISSHALFGDRKEVIIEHDGAAYRLKITKQGKLILNK
ncbi:hemin uptake protein HemP [Hoeflea ulvae]|uniref:Hemin uptake protein HemP n=1 Tax=Hoeflea ulvae TaxID=2983764 RepID=A0ABT3YGD3_9HYPH|nr:hemin uptake protein HemP [Hoeflea ulvae]MCY0094957.1 hemin uptake protein HemP [Hoeflea ulvae]